VYDVRRSLIQSRLAQGVSLYALAKRAKELRPDVSGLRHWAFSQWEDLNSGRSPSDVQLEAWAEALGLRLELVEVEAGAAAAGDELDPPTGARVARRRAA
jgi:hypothetical protein